MPNIYVVTGSEDGIVAARTCARAAVDDALDYCNHGANNTNRAERHAIARHLKREGIEFFSGRDGITATVERFIDSA